ncbi:unnamed protein product [Prorocentrum cordatum]|uniref:Uncharacterized protein n=1 Tax=Prorocentrum cordatum TaxID=2364126 RepID=A0ABN9TSM6_9DINO|nr:unnamed protein product [Polarella glacialis]
MAWSRRMSAFAESYRAECAATALRLDQVKMDLAGHEARFGTLSSAHEVHAQEVADIRSRLAGCDEGHPRSSLATLAEDSSMLRAKSSRVLVRARELQKDGEARLRADVDFLARQLGAMQKRLRGPEEAAVMCELGHIRSALSAREGEASICELRRGQQDLAARLKAAEAGLESLRQQELRGAPGGAVGDVDRAQSRLREQVEMMQGRLDALVETQSQTATALEGLQGWCATELEGLRKLSGHQHTSLVERLNYLGFLGFSAGRRAERPASARAKLGQTSGRPSAREADRPGAEARGAAPHEAPPLGASLCERIDLLEDVVGTLAQEWPGSALAHSRPEPPRSGSAATRRSPPPDGGGDSAQTTVRCAWDEPVPCRLDQMPRPAATRQRSAPSSRGRVDHARASGATSACYGAASARYASRSVPATAPPAPALRAHGSCATAPQKAVRYAAVHESLKLFEGRSGTPQRMPSTLDRASVSYRPCSTPRSWLGLAAR